MGVVYQAQQQLPIRRDVALKIIKPGMDSREVIARFEIERQALAVMDHPNIARVFDAGTTSNGRPYFAMELVEGIPITDYCDSKRLSIQERIQLFIPICKAIQHAHQKGIIHRDIKPSNILVTERDANPVPKVIDFGLAKALGQQLSDGPTMTNFGNIVGTPDYMSPEQAEFSRQDIDTRSDVYSLGAVLYELLTGAIPLKREGLANIPYFEVLKRIREEETPPPSTRLRQSTTVVDTASKRQSDSSRLPKLLHGELDWITMKALEKDRTRRYETVNGLARDLQRYLQGEPVEAGPPSTRYRMSKLVKKHRVLLATASAFVILLLVGVVVSSWLAVRANRAEQEARAVNEFLQNDLLAQASAYAQARPDTKVDPDLKVRTTLDRAAERIEGKFKSQPLVEGSIRQTIGNAYKDLGLFPEADRQLGRALELRRSQLGEAHAQTLTTMNSIAQLYVLQGKRQPAVTLYEKVRDNRRRILGDDHPDTLKTGSDLAEVYQLEGKYAEAAPLFTHVLERERRVLGNHHPQTLETMDRLAVLHRAEGKYAEAEPLYLEVLELRRRDLGEEHPDTLIASNNLALLYQYEGKLSDAEMLFKKTVEGMRRVLGKDHIETLIAMGNLGIVYFRQGKFSEVEPIFIEVMETKRRVLGEEHPETLTSMNNLGVFYRQQGKYPQAEALYAKVIEVQRRVLGEEHPNMLLSMNGLGLLYERQGKTAQAQELYAKVIGVQRRVLGDEHPDTINTVRNLAALHLANHKYVEAESLLRDLVSNAEKTKSNTWQRFDLQSMLGAALAGQKKYDKAEPLLVSAYAGLSEQRDSIPVPAKSSIDSAGERIVQLYQGWNQPEKAAEWTKKLRDNKP
jgi:non-specific serine/threonine protein kinase/serine/threonine-protein kinase